MKGFSTITSIHTHGVLYNYYLFDNNKLILLSKSVGSSYLASVLIIPGSYGQGVTAFGNIPQTQV